MMRLLLSRLWRIWLLWKPHTHHRWLPFGLRLRLGWRWSVRKLMPLPRRLMWQLPVLSSHAMVSQLLVHLRLCVVVAVVMLVVVVVMPLLI